MSRLAGLEGNGSGFRIPYLTNHNNIWILPEDRSESSCEGDSGLRIYLDLIDALNVELNGIFHSDDIDRWRIKLVEAGIECRGLPASSRARDEHDPLRPFDNVLYVDSDVICNTRENIFNLVDGTFEMAGVYESDIMTGLGVCGYNSWDKSPDKREMLKRKLDRLNIPMTPTSPPARPSCFGMFNTGVRLWTKEGRHKAREKFDD